MARALIVQILGDARQYGAELDKAAGKTRQMGKVAGVAGLALAGGLAYGLDKSVKAAMDAQVETARLGAAFKTAGLNVDNYKGQIENVEASSRKLGFSNEDVRGSLGSLIVATHNVKGAMSDLGVAEDLARFKHVDLGSASKVLTMAMAGSQRAVKQLGLSLQPVTTAEDKVKLAFKDHTTEAYKTALATAKLSDKQRTAAQVIQLVKDKMGGQAKAFADTAAGGMQQFHAQIGNIEEKLGQGLLPAITLVIGKISDLASWLGKHTTIAKILVIALGGLAAVLIAVSVATTIASAATAVFGAVMATATLPILAIIAAVVLLGVAAYEIYKHWGAIKAFFTSLWNDVKGIFNAGIAFVKDHWQAFVIALATIIAGPIGLLVSYIATHWAQIKQDAVGAWNAIRDAADRIWGAVKDAITGPLNAARGVALNIWDGVKGAWSSAWKAMEGAALGPINSVIGAIQTLIGWVEKVIHLIGSIHTPSGGPASSGGTKPGQPRGPKGGRAAGGIAIGPSYPLIGEAGPEAIIPLSRGSLAKYGLGGGGGVMQVNLNVDGKTLARILIDPLRSEAKLLERSTGRPAFS